MLKLPKGLKKKKKGKKSKRKGEDEIFTEEELQKYRKDHQQPQPGEGEEGTAKENEEWSKFKDLTTGIDSVLKKTQGDLDRIKSTSFFQRVPAGVKEVKQSPKRENTRPVVEVTEADFPKLVQAAAAAAAAEADDDDRSEYGVTDDESEEDDQDDIFDTSYVEAVERGECKLAYVPDSPEDNIQDDDIFDTSHVDALIKGQETKSTKGKKALDIGVAVEVLTGRIDNVALPITKRPKRVIPGDLLLESTDSEVPREALAPVGEPVEKSLLDIDSDAPITSPIDLSVSLHTSLIQQNKKENPFEVESTFNDDNKNEVEEEVDEFSLLAAESLEAGTEVAKSQTNPIKLEPVLQESWSAFEAHKNTSVFAEGIVEDDAIVDPYIDQDDPFDTSFADAVVHKSSKDIQIAPSILEEDDDFDPRADEVRSKLNNRRKSSVRIHLTDPSGLRESITSDDVIEKVSSPIATDLLSSSTTDLTQIGDSPLDPLDINDTEIDPFDTTIVDKISAPGKVELKLLEQELIGATPPVTVYRVPSDPDFDPRAEEPTHGERRASRPENLAYNKSVVFSVEEQKDELSVKHKTSKPVTPYYTRDLSITDDIEEEAESADKVPDILTRTRSDEDLTLRSKVSYQAKRRHSEFNQSCSSKSKDLLQSETSDIQVKVLTPCFPQPSNKLSEEGELDPFDTSFASVAPCKTELKLLAKEFSCEETGNGSDGPPDFLDPSSDDIFQVKALTPEPSTLNQDTEDFDPFDTSFADVLNPGKTELKLLESEFLN